MITVGIYTALNVAVQFLVGILNAIPVLHPPISVSVVLEQPAVFWSRKVPCDSEKSQSPFLSCSDFFLPSDRSTNPSSEKIELTCNFFHNQKILISEHFKFYSLTNL